MRRLTALAATLLAALLAGAAHAAPPPVELWRLDCGELWEGNLDEFSDTYAYVGKSKRLVVSCYLIRHGESYMLWDAGLEKADLGKALVENNTESEALRVIFLSSRNLPFAAVPRRLGRPATAPASRRRTLAGTRW